MAPVHYTRCGKEFLVHSDATLCMLIDAQERRSEYTDPEGARDTI